MAMVPVWVLGYKRGARGHVHVPAMEAEGCRARQLWQIPARISGRPVPAGANRGCPQISHFEQPSLPKIALDIKVSIVGRRRAETPNGEEEVPESGPPLARWKWAHPCSVKANEPRYHLIRSKVENADLARCSGTGFAASQKIFCALMASENGNPPAVCRSDWFDTRLIVDAVSGENYGLLIAKYGPGIADAGREISRAETRCQRATETPGVPTFAAPEG